MTTKVQGGAVTKEWETDSVTVSFDIDTRIATVTAYFPSPTPLAGNETQELVLIFRNFDGARRYPFIDGDALWENRNSGDSLCHYVSGDGKIQGYTLSESMLGEFNFLCKSTPRTGNAFNTVVEGTFLIMLDPAVTSPKKDQVLEPLRSYDIEWDLPGRDRIDLAFTLETDPDRSDIDLLAIAEGIDADLEFYTWEVPDTMSPQAFIVVYDSETGERIGNSQQFKIRDERLARISTDSDGPCPSCPYYERFNPAIHGWSLPNVSESYGPLYRSDVDRFQYTRAVDPVTGHPYYQLAAPPIVGREHYFPEWPNWVGAFGIDACYITTDGGLIPSDMTALQWKYTTEDGFGGVCYGLSAGAALAFLDPNFLRSRFPSLGEVETVYSTPITNEIRDAMSTLHSFQFSRSFAEVKRSFINNGPFPVLTTLKEMLKEDDLSGATSSPIVVIENWGPRGGGHALLAYEIEEMDNDPEARIYVYDPNWPGDEETYITINSFTDEWSYEPLGWSGRNKIFLPEPLSNFSRVPIIDPETDLFTPIRTSRGMTINARGSNGEFDYSNASGFSASDPSILPQYGINGPNPPYGYLIDDGPYIADLTAADSSGIALALFRDDLAFNYESDATDGQTDRVAWGEDWMTITNPGATPRTFTFNALFKLEEGSRMIAVNGLELAGGDSIRFEIVEDDLRAINYGGATGYEITIRQITRDGFDEGSYDPVDLAAGATHTLAPEWWNLGTRLPIFVDPAGGGAADTLYLLNHLMGVDDAGASTVSGIRIASPLPDLSTMTMTLEQAGTLRVDAHDALGTNVATLFEGRREKGTLELPIDARVLAPGYYILHITVDGRSAGSASVMRVR